MFKIFILKPRRNICYSAVWVCPNCGAELPYRGEGNMRCPNCDAWMQEE